MPNTNVKIIIKQKPAGSALGWPGQSFTPCVIAGTAQTSDKYAYKFSGGNWNSNSGGSAGGFQFKHKKKNSGKDEPPDPKVVDITVEDSDEPTNASLYEITKIDIDYDSATSAGSPNKQTNVPGNNTGQIEDDNDRVDSGYYKVAITVTSDPGAGELECDPRWQNW